MKKKIFLFVLLLISITATRLTVGETMQPKIPFSNQTIVSSDTNFAQMQTVQENLKNEVARLKEKVDTASGMMNLLIGVLVAVLAIGGATSFVSWFIAEHRTGEAERRTSEGHSLLMNALQATHKRAEEVHQTFLQGSKDTLDLVNATLTLAKEASERAARSIETKAITNLKELDRKSKELFTKGAKRLVAETVLRSEVHRLAQKIAGFEINLFILPPGFKLTPYCLFIRGIDFHVNQQFDDALECWKSVAHDDESPNELKSQAWYWIGIENNNFGDFSEA